VETENQTRKKALVKMVTSGLYGREYQFDDLDEHPVIGRCCHKVE